MAKYKVTPKTGPDKGKTREYEPNTSAKSVGAALEGMGGMLGKAARDLRKNKYKVDRYDE